MEEEFVQSIEVAAFPDRKQLEAVLIDYKTDKITLHNTIQSIERLEEANARFQGLALTQASIKLMAMSKDEQHEDFGKLIKVLAHPIVETVNTLNIREDLKSAKHKNR